MKPEWKNCIRAGITIIVIYLFIHYWGSFAGVLLMLYHASFPLIAGACLAYVVNIPMSFFEKKLWKNANNKAAVKLRRPVAIILAYVCTIIVFAFVFNLVAPEITNGMQILGKKLGYAIVNVAASFHPDDELYNRIYGWFAGTDIQTLIKNIYTWMSTGFTGALKTVYITLNTVFSVFITIFLSFIFSLYFLAGKDRLKIQFEQILSVYLSRKMTDRIMYVLGTFDNSFHSYIVGQCLEAAILGSLCTIGMTIFGFPYSVPTGALIGLTALIPVAGCYIGALTGALLMLTVSPFKSIMFLVFIMLLQQVENNLIYPKVVGTKIGLPGLWVLAAVTLGGSALGIGGIMIAVPLTSAFYQLLRADVKKRL